MLEIMKRWKTLLVEGSMERRKSSKSEIKNLIIRARNYSSDAGQEVISLDLRFQAAYEAGRMWCEIALRAAGYRAKSAAGHHEAVISSIPEILGPDAVRLAEILNKARKIRHTIMYAGEFQVTTKTKVENLLSTVAQIEKSVTNWLKDKHPDFLPDELS